MLKNSLKKNIKILTEQSGQRLDNFLKKNLFKVPKCLIYKMIRKGVIKVNKKKVKCFYKIKDKDQIKLPNIKIKKQKNINFSFFKRNKNLETNIVYEDKYIIAINKPSGVAVHGGSGIKLGMIEKLRILKPENKFLELVHRIDRDTSGILLIAKKSSILRNLHLQIYEKKIKKTYIALVKGKWSNNIQKIKLPLIKKNFRNSKIVYVNKLGKESETRFEKIENFGNIATLMKVMPITGRTHQIRVHLSYIGHPIAFDKKYGDKKFDDDLKFINVNRLFLHAESLFFIHPNNKKTIKINVPIDKKLQNSILKLRNKN